MDVDLGALDSLGDDAIDEILQSWSAFCACIDDLLLPGDRDAPFAAPSQLAPLVGTLCGYGLATLVRDHFLRALQESFKKNAVSKFWLHFDAYDDASILERDKVLGDWPQEVLSKSLGQICSERAYQEKCLVLLVHSLQAHVASTFTGGHQLDIGASDLSSTYQLMVSSVLLTSLPSHFPDILRCYFRKKLDELSGLMSGEYEEGSSIQLYGCDKFKMDIDECYQRMTITKNHILVKDIGKIVHDLRSLGFTSMTEDAYASAIFLLLKAKVRSLAGDDYRNPVLDSVKEWIQAVPLQFLYALLAYLGDSVDNDTMLELKSPLASRPVCLQGSVMPSEAIVRWQLRLEYFAYETLQDLRISKLFEIIVDYPDSSPAIEDLRQCLEYTGQHSKLVDLFISSLRYRLLTAGASTNDILHQYVSTIKALRTIDPTGVFLEAVGEPIRDYLRGRKDTIKCIVTMLTDGSGGNPSGTGNSGDSLLEELNRDAENQDSADYDDDFNIDDRQAWLNAERWEPDPVEADPSKGSRNRRKLNILGIMVGIIGSKDQLVNEYRVMLAEKLLNKSDYDIDSEIRILELLKIHFGESSMQKCEIMLNDLIDSKRTNINIKASIPEPSQSGDKSGDDDVSLEVLDATIISSNFWPSIQSEAINIPAPMEHLLSDYGKRYHEIKAPRKLLWMKNLGTVKLELQFEGKSLQFSVAPVHAAIIMKFQEQTSWTSKDLAEAIGLPVDSLNKRMSFWISKGILVESLGTESDDHVYTIVDDSTDMNRNGITSGSCEEVLCADEEGESSVASVEEQLQKEMTVYEKFIIGMLTNFGSMTLDRIHNTLKMFCIAEPSYDKSLQQLQSFLSSLVLEEKLEMRDGSYILKK